MYRWIPSLAQKFFNGGNPFLFPEVSGKDMTGVLGQNADEHDAVVLNVRTGNVF